MDAYILTDGEDIKRVSRINDFGELFTDLPDDFMGKSHLYKVVNGVVKQVISEEGDRLVPSPISPRQGMIQLERMGNLHQVEQTVYNLAIITGDEQTGKEAVITWEKATTWERNDATVLFIADLLQWTAEMIDDFFVNASKIV
jgi:hypothetical protein